MLKEKQIFFNELYLNWTSWRFYTYQYVIKHINVNSKESLSKLTNFMIDL